MLSSVEIKPDVYFVGALDWNAREFHGYTTEQGITYNAYLILDEKVTLIDTVKRPFSEELVERIKSIIDPAKIDVLICNHIEMDHSGSVPRILELAPNAEVYASAPQGVKELKAFYGENINVNGVKTGDTLNIGKRTLTFVQTPMVHWPDNMVTYSDYDKILFSNDAFGQHYASTTRFEDESDYCEVMKQARKYYANIVLPYGRQADSAVTAVKGIGLEKALVVYDSMWGSTDKMAHALLDGFLAEGIPAQLIDLKETHISNVMYHFLDSKYVCVGSPTLNSKFLPTVSSFLTYMSGLSPKNDHRIGFAFGSYGWAPLGPKMVQAELEAAEFTMPLPVHAIGWLPSDEDLDAVRAQVKDLVEAGKQL